ncbi:hypothetical protein M569_14585, partial [Genlisea aurea]
SREVDDEETLMWAALEKLPTNVRMRRGFLTDEKGNIIREIDVKNLGLEEGRNLIERLVKNPVEDNEKFLLKLKDRFQRVGLNLPTIEVRFENLNVNAEVYAGGRALPTIYNFLVNVVEDFFSRIRIVSSQKKAFPILRDVTGIIKPGRMTLLLGPPCSGKTTLLLALSGKLDPRLEVSGKVTYNGHEMNEFVPQRSSAYISQHDVHIPEMTVRETLEFSARCQGVGPRYEMLVDLLRREKAAKVRPDTDLDIFLKAISIEDQVVSVSVDYVIK